MKSSTSIILVLVISTSLLLVFFTAVQGSTEFVLEPTWSSMVDDSMGANPQGSIALLNYPSGVLAVDESGQNRLYPVGENSSNFAERFTRWKSDGSGIEIYGANGKLETKVEKTVGIPLLSVHGFAILSRSMQYLQWFSFAGELQWSMAIDSPLIGLESNSEGLVFLLTLDGHLLAVDSKGIVVSQWVAPQSRVNIALGLCSLDDTTLCVVTGLDKQNMSMVHWADNNFSTQWTLALHSEYRTDVLLKAMKQGSGILIEQENELWAVNRSGHVDFTVPAFGQVRTILNLEGSSAFLILRDALEGSYLEVYTNQGQRILNIGPSQDLYDCVLVGRRTLVISSAEGLIGYTIGTR